MTDQIPHVPNDGAGANGVAMQRREASVSRGTERLRAPFPYYGGKGRWASLIWERLGSPGVYVEPFLGSGAVLLAKPGGPAPREVVCDMNGHICNFYRALRADPDEVAYHADWPTIHQDLTARHRWLLRWGAEHAERLSEDAEWYDAKAAGWWAWGISSWIGHGWCDAGAGDDQRPFMQNDPSGQGVQQQRTTLPVEDKRPRVNERGGQGVQAQRDQVPAGAEDYDRRPYICTSNSSGQGIQQQCFNARGEGILTGERLQPWFRALAQRLARVIVLNRSWESAFTPSVLQQTPSSPKPLVGCFLDPPYKTDTGRSTGLYVGDRAGTSDDVATAAYEWAVEHGDRFRIAYACHAGDFPVPDGWDVVTMGFSGHRDERKKAENRDAVYFSPPCVGQGKLFAC